MSVRVYRNKEFELLDDVYRSDSRRVLATLAARGIPPDFQSDRVLNWIHRRAGGTDLYPNMKRRQQTPRSVVGLARVAELSDRPSWLNPLWYGGAFAIGLAAGAARVRVVAELLLRWSCQAAGLGERRRFRSAEAVAEAHALLRIQLFNKPEAVVQRSRPETESGAGQLLAWAPIPPVSVIPNMSRMGMPHAWIVS